MTMLVNLTFVDDAGDVCGSATLPPVDGYRFLTRLEPQIADLLVESGISYLSFVRCYEKITPTTREVWIVVWVHRWSASYRLQGSENRQMVRQRSLPRAVERCVEQHRCDSDCGRGVCGCPGWTRRATEFAANAAGCARFSTPSITRYVATPARTVLRMKWGEERIFLYGDSLCPDETAASWWTLSRVAEPYFPRVLSQSLDGQLLAVAAAAGSQLVGADSIDTQAVLRDLADVQQRMQDASSVGEPFAISRIGGDAFRTHLRWLDRFGDEALGENPQLSGRIDEFLQWTDAALNGPSWIHTDLAIHNVFWDGTRCNFIDVTDSVVASPILAVPKFYRSLRHRRGSTPPLCVFLLAYMTNWMGSPAAPEALAYVVRNESFMVFLDRLVESFRRARITGEHANRGYLDADMERLATREHRHLAALWQGVRDGSSVLTELGAFSPEPKRLWTVGRSGSA